MILSWGNAQGVFPFAGGQSWINLTGQVPAWPSKIAGGSGDQIFNTRNFLLPFRASINYRKESRAEGLLEKTIREIKASRQKSPNRKDEVLVSIRPNCTQAAVKRLITTPLHSTGRNGPVRRRLFI